ncbi:MAG: NUDIX hydrolase [Candidatus Rokubacteria bacterium]|nr:NUDIX hydrolase [Candidatus Rokubacteria bacterium]
MSREYPAYPRVGVGAVVFHQGRVLLVRRGGSPSMGKWTLPGGLVELGETAAEAVCRELREECAIDIDLVDVAGVFDRVVRDADGRIRYHYVLIDYLATAVSDAICAGDDAAEAQWVDIDHVAQLDVTDGLMPMLARALALAERHAQRRTDAPGGPGS